MANGDYLLNADGTVVLNADGTWAIQPTDTNDCGCCASCDGALPTNGDAPYASPPSGMPASFSVYLTFGSSTITILGSTYDLPASFSTTLYRYGTSSYYTEDGSNSWPYEGAPINYSVGGDVAEAQLGMLLLRNPAECADVWDAFGSCTNSEKKCSIGGFLMVLWLDNGVDTDVVEIIYGIGQSYGYYTNGTLCCDTPMELSGHVYSGQMKYPPASCGLVGTDGSTPVDITLTLTYTI